MANCQRLQDGVHGSHVEEEAQLGDTHSDEAQQEDGAENALHEGLSCRGNDRSQIGSGRTAASNKNTFVFAAKRHLNIPPGARLSE